MTTKCVLSLAAILLATGVANASTCAGLPPDGPAYVIFNGTTTSPVSSPASFSCGGLTFSNFIGVDGGNNPTPYLTLTNANVTGGNVSLTFNPLLGPGQDLYLYYNVSGGIQNGISLTTGGAGALVAETACSAPIINGVTYVVNPGNTCSPGTGLISGGSFAAASNQTVTGTLTSTSSNTFIFKDIGVSTGTSTSSAGVTSVSQGFNVVPEPMTFVLMGSGLLAIGMFHRRKKA